MVVVEDVRQVVRHSLLGNREQGTGNRQQGTGKTGCKIPSLPISKRSARLDAIERQVQTSEANLTRQISDLKTPLDPDKRLSRVEPQLPNNVPQPDAKCDTPVQTPNFLVDRILRPGLCS
jgi:hypothetical protein